MAAGFLKGSNARNVLFGCTPHQPGSWLAVGRQSVALHELGFVEVVPVPQGLLARRQVDPKLYFLPGHKLVSGGRLGAFTEDWQPVYTSSFGNVLLLERRVLGERLVLSCEGGLIAVSGGYLNAVAPAVAPKRSAARPGSFELWPRSFRPVSNDRHR